jgi:maltose O-acetyltransferase
MSDAMKKSLGQRMKRLLGRVRAAWVLRGAELGRGVCATGRVDVEGRQSLHVGDGVTFLGGMIPTRIAIAPDAEMKVGEGSLFNYGVDIKVGRSLRIGRRCMFASMVEIDGRCGAVAIGDDVWIAHGAVIGPGVCIGDGSVVAAGSVLSRDVPQGCLAMGAPARIVALRALDRGAGPQAAESHCRAGAAG